MSDDVRPTPISPEDADGLRCSLVVCFEKAGQDDEYSELLGIVRWDGADLVFHHESGKIPIPRAAVGRLRRLHPTVPKARDADVMILLRAAPLPADRSGLVDTGVRLPVAGRKHPCPCCGHLVFDEPGSYESCPICDWEDDISQLRFATMGGGANKLSLMEAQASYAARALSPPPDAQRDPSWRPVESEDVEVPVAGVVYGSTYPETVEELYYWRPTYFRRREGR